MAGEEVLADVEDLFQSKECDIKMRRTFDGERFAMFFVSDLFGTCGSVQTDEMVALVGALGLLKERLLFVITERRASLRAPTPSHWMAL